jgi:hypothetical protein
MIVESWRRNSTPDDLTDIALDQANVSHQYLWGVAMQSASDKAGGEPRAPERRQTKSKNPFLIAVDHPSVSGRGDLVYVSEKSSTPLSCAAAPDQPDPPAPPDAPAQPAAPAPADAPIPADTPAPTDGGASRNDGQGGLPSGDAVPSPDEAPPPAAPGAAATTSDPASQTVETHPAWNPLAKGGKKCTELRCVNDRLFKLYLGTPKMERVDVQVETSVPVRLNGKITTVTRTVTRHEWRDFSGKDVAAAVADGMSLEDYVIGGMDPHFSMTLYDALHKARDAGFLPGITSAFRGKGRQLDTDGPVVAPPGMSFHGDRYGYGHGLAADIIDWRGGKETEELWEYIDAHDDDKDKDKKLGVCRPYGKYDPPHVAPFDGDECALHRKTQHADAKAGGK